VLNITGSCCPEGSAVDAAGACCDAGELDACGVCGGNGVTVDIMGRCCSTLLDAQGLCCEVSMANLRRLLRMQNSVEIIIHGSPLRTLQHTLWLEHALPPHRQRKLRRKRPLARKPLPAVYKLC
jgi:hypothetical protein